LATIRLEGLSVFGHHGARPYEKEAGQRLEVDLELEPLDNRAEDSDQQCHHHKRIGAAQG
jgi:dihydroneopterin aldolase